MSSALLAFSLLMLVLAASQVAALIHLPLWILHRDGPVSRFVLLGLIPVISYAAMLLLPILAHTSRPGRGWHWLLDQFTSTWIFLPPVLAMIVFGVEWLARGRVNPLVLKSTVLLAYVGAAGAFYQVWLTGWD